MAEGKNNIMVYRDWISIFEDLTDEEAGRLIKHFFKYVNDLNPDPPDRLTGLMFKPIELTLKRDLKKWEKKSEKNREIALMRWHKKDANACERTKRNANNADKDNDKDKDKDKDKEINISFIEFWNLYNKKQGSKSKCEKKWIKLSDEERQNIIDTLPEFIDSISDKQFQPFPETYLNQRRWEDEIKHEIQKYSNADKNGMVW